MTVFQQNISYRHWHLNRIINYTSVFIIFSSLKIMCEVCLRIAAPATMNSDSALACGPQFADCCLNLHTLQHWREYLFVLKTRCLKLYITDSYLTRIPIHWHINIILGFLSFLTAKFPAVFFASNCLVCTICFYLKNTALK